MIERVARRLLVCASTVCMLTTGCAGDTEPLRISTSGYGAYEVSLAPWAGGLAAVWYDTRDGNAEIYLQQVLAPDQNGGRDWRITETQTESFEADVAAVGDGIAISWYEKRDDASTSAQLALVSMDGAITWQRSISVSHSSSRNPVIANFGKRLFVAWIEADDTGNEHVQSQWWDAAGTRIGDSILLGVASPTTWNLNAVIDAAGVAHVVFDASVGTRAEELYWSTIDGFRVETRRVTPDDGYRSKYPDIEIASGRVALTWFDDRHGNNEIYLYVADSARMVGLSDIDALATRVTTTSGDSIGAYLASSGGRLGLAWSDNTGGAYDIFFRSYDTKGKSLTPVKGVTRTSSQSLIPAIVPWESGFAIAWNEVERGEQGYHGDATRSEVQYVLIP